MGDVEGTDATGRPTGETVAFCWRSEAYASYWASDAWADQLNPDGSEEGVECIGNGCAATDRGYTPANPPPATAKLAPLSLGLEFDRDKIDAPAATQVKPSWIEGFVNDLLEPVGRARRTQAIQGLRPKRITGSPTVETPPRSRHIGRDGFWRRLRRS